MHGGQGTSPLFGGLFQRLTNALNQNSLRWSSPGEELALPNSCHSQIRNTSMISSDQAWSRSACQTLSLSAGLFHPDETLASQKEPLSPPVVSISVACGISRVVLSFSLSLVSQGPQQPFGPSHPHKHPHSHPCPC